MFTTLLAISGLAVPGVRTTRPASAEQAAGIPGPSRVDAGLLDVGDSAPTTCALLPHGGMRCWGIEQSGNFGGSSLTRDAVPPGYLRATSVSVGGADTCLVLENGALSCWGNTPSMNLPPGSATAVSVNGSGMCAVTPTGGMRCVGYDQPDWGWTAGSNASTDAPFVNVPAGGVVSAVSLAGLTSCALFSTGGVRCFGPPSGPFAAAVVSGSSLTADVPGLPPMASISNNGSTGCGVSNSGNVHCWGANPNDIVRTSGAAEPMSGLGGPISAISIGDGACALRTDAAVLCWGNDYTAPGAAPVVVAFGPDQNGSPAVVTAVSVGDNHACAMLTTSEVRCWGEANRLAGSSPTTSVPFVVASPGASAATATTAAGGNGQGAAAHQLSHPWSVATDTAGGVSVVDNLNQRVQRWSPGATAGVTVAGGNGAGAGVNQLNNPFAVQVDEGGNTFVGDYGNSRVQKFAPGAPTGVTVAGGNGFGTDLNQATPLGLALDSANNLYVADGPSNRVQRWSPGATSGVTVAGGSGSGSDAQQLAYPIGIATDPAGNLYVADFNNNRVQRWAPGATAGTTVAGGHGSGNGADQIDGAVGVAVDRGRNVYVADFRNHRIQRWAPGATSGVTVLGGNGPGAGATQLRYPNGVALDLDGNLFVADFANDRVQKLNIDTTPPTADSLTATPSVISNVGQTATLTATGTDNFRVTKVEFYAGAALIGTDTTPSDGFIQVIATFQPGVNTYTAKVFDGAGNSATSQPATVTMPGAPDTNITGGPADGSTSSSGTASFAFEAVPASGATFECSLDAQAFATCISGVTVGGLANGSHTYRVRAIGVGGTDPTPAVRTWTVAILAAPVFTASTPPPTGTVGTPYVSYQYVASGTAPITFTVSSGALPAGLNLSPGGLLNGTPTAPGTSSFIVSAANGTSPNATASASIVVSAAPPAAGDLRLTMETEEGLFRPNWVSGYVLTVRNIAPTSVAGPVTVTDVLPNGLRYLTAGGAGWACAAVGQTVTCTRSSPLPAGVAARLLIGVRVLAPRGTVLTNSATAAPNDLTPANNRASLTVTVK